MPQQQPLDDLCGDLLQAQWDEGAITHLLVKQDEVAELEARLQQHFDWSPVDDSWQQHLINQCAPIETEKFYIPPPTKIPLLIRSTGPFGTGHHPTTLRCLQLIEHQSPKKILDLGCGTGILALAAAALGAEAVASDCDPDAVATAQENAQRNQLTINVVEAFGVDHPTIRDNAPYDTIVANLYAPLLIALAPELPPLLAPGGRLIFSGMLEEQAADVCRPFTLIESYNEEGWVTLLLQEKAR